MYSDTQMMKGILEGCILKMIEPGELYGYEAVEKINRAGFHVNEATVYPILTRLERNGWIGCEKRFSPYGPPRKYYSITAEGRTILNSFIEAWIRLGKIVNRVLEVENND